MKFLFSTNFPLVTHGLAKALQECGHEVEILDMASCYERDPGCLKALITSVNPDFVVTEGGWYKFWDSLVYTLANLNIPHIYWAREDPPFFDTLCLPYGRYCTMVFTTAQECLDLYAAHGIEAHLLMFACLPSFHHHVEPDFSLSSDLMFVGTNFGRFEPRERGINIILKPLVEKNFNVKIYGNDWWLDATRQFSINSNFYGEWLDYERTRTAYASSKIVLGIHSVENSPTMMSMRTFEVLGCGAFFLTQWTPAIENLFENHKHLVWSKSPEETLHLADYYLSHQAARESIARQGQAEVYSKHTYIHRAQDMLRLLHVVKVG
ncbi:MAG TPA: glycosyltransferase [Syntrophomonadaceae bacterium]|nr:glycosyltransferase [Syntrophomonadaceae bacterium]